MTMASSVSESSFACGLGPRRTGSNGPHREPIAFRKTSGSAGGFMLNSAIVLPVIEAGGRDLADAVDRGKVGDGTVDRRQMRRIDVGQGAGGDDVRGDVGDQRT